MHLARFLSCLVFAAIIALSPHAGAAFPTVALKPVCLQQIHSPTTITSANDGSGRLFVCDQPGKIYIIQGGMLLPTPFLNIASPSNAAPNNGPGPAISQNTGYNERGLLGLAFHPGYSDSLSPGYRKFYVLYSKSYVAGTDPAPPQTGDPVASVTVIAEYQVSASDPNAADPASERRLLMWTRPQTNHNGGQLEFGPDGYLYIASGDGGQQEDNNVGHTGGSTAKPNDAFGNGQDKTRYLGKILRIDPIGAAPFSYTIPSSNPFFNDPTPGLKKEIYSYGMRNPWRFSFDKRAGGTNRLFCGDVGGNRIEEVDIIVSGGNYGWRYKEGHEFPTFSSGASTNPMPNPGGTMIDPIAEYAHPGVVTTSPVLPQLGLSVTGGFVYRGSAIPAMQGKYVFGDYGATSGASDGRLMGLEETSPLSGVFTLTQALPLFGIANPVVGLRILCFGEDEAGEIYIGMKTNSGVLQLDGSGFPAGSIYKIVPVQSASANITSSKDNTIFSDTVPYPPTTGYPSDALGYLYAGKTGSNNGPYLRRALMSFDIASKIPAGAVIQSAQLSLRLTMLAPSSFGTTMTLHRLSETWGEGTSMNANDRGTGAQATVGDATWVRRFFDTQSWTTPGGTFSASASGSATLAYPTTVIASSAQMVSDVQGWLTTPSGNAGWILRGDETVESTAFQFASRDKGPVPPTLSVTYQSGPAPTHFESWVSTYFPTNLVGQYIDPAKDFAGDAVPNLVKYAYGLSPFQPFPAGSWIQGGINTVGTDDIFTFTFQRDELATDLKYELQTSTDLVSWTTITTSVGGAAPSGSGFVSESGSGIRTVTASETFPTPAMRFARLRVTRLQ